MSTTDLAQEARSAVEAADKRFNTLRASLALAGYTLTVMDAGIGQAAYVVASWNLSRVLASLDDVGEFGQRAGVHL